MASKRSSTSDKSQHAKYKVEQLWSKNRKTKLERALKNSPNNLQIAAALKNISYRRCTPKSKQWSHSTKALAHLVKQISGFCDKNIFHPNKDIREAAYANIRAHSKIGSEGLKLVTKGTFSIKERAHFKGVPVWA